jgi:hypothetical protein
MATIAPRCCMAALRRTSPQGPARSWHHAGMRALSGAVLVMLLAGCGGTPAGASDGDTSSGSESTTGTTSPQAPETSDGDATSDDDGEHECGGFELVPTYVRPHVMFVVDVSASMLEGWEHDDDPSTPTVSRWHSVRALLEQLIPAIEDPILLGLVRAPASDACLGGTCTDANVCLVEPEPEIEIGENNGAQILVTLPDSFASSLEIVGASPIAAAYSSARDHLLAQAEDMPSYIVLITDGGANCVEPSLPEAVEVFDAGLEAMVGEAYSTYGIGTIVVAVDVAEQPSSAALPDTPAVDAQAALDAIALAGGLPRIGGSEPRKFFEVRDIEDLQVMFESACQVTDCTVDLTTSPAGPPEPVQIPLMEIEMEGLEVPYVSECASEDGWSWIEEGEVLTFCGLHCEKFKLGAFVDVAYGCPLPN